MATVRREFQINCSRDVSSLIGWRRARGKRKEERRSISYMYLSPGWEERHSSNKIRESDGGYIYNMCVCRGEGQSGRWWEQCQIRRSDDVLPRLSRKRKSCKACAPWEIEFAALPLYLYRQTCVACVLRPGRRWSPADASRALSDRFSQIMGAGSLRILTYLGVLSS